MRVLAKASYFTSGGHFNPESCISSGQSGKGELRDLKMDVKFKITITEKNYL
jgi:hypothetical protein